MSLAPLRVLALLLLAVAACSSPPRPDLARLYALQQQDPPPQPPVVLVHGSLGARLVVRAADGLDERWPGPLARLALSDYRELALAIDPERLEPLPDRLEPAGITERAAGRDFYGRILRVLEQAGGFHRGEAGVPARPGERRYYVFSYDWRQDNVRSAALLDRFIERIREDYADPHLKVDVIAHSMGGLIVRYYLRYGTHDALDDNEFRIDRHGVDRIRRIVLLGTPNLGSILAFDSLVNGYRVGLRRMRPEVLATFPSGYQLLPHPINVWLVKPDGEELLRDLFDVGFWQRFELSVFDPAVIARLQREAPTAEEGAARVALLQRYFHRQIERARRFVWSLTVPMPGPPVRHIVFGSDCHLTPARVLVEESGGDSVLRFAPEAVMDRRAGVDYERLMLEPGDGVVTRASLLARHVLDPGVERHRYSDFPLDYAFYLCDRHDALTGNVNFQDNLLHALLAVDE